jgi:hypothetical protein
MRRDKKIIIIINNITVLEGGGGGGREVDRSQVKKAKRDSGRLGTTRTGATGKSNIEAAGGTMTGQFVSGQIAQ